MEHLQGVKNGLGALPARLILGELLPALPVVGVLLLLPLPVLPLLCPLPGPLALPGPGADLCLSPAALFGPAAAGLRPLRLPLGKEAFKIKVLLVLFRGAGQPAALIQQLIKVEIPLIIPVGELRPLPLLLEQLLIVEV